MAAKDELQILCDNLTSTIASAANAHRSMIEEGRVNAGIVHASIPPLQHMLEVFRNMIEAIKVSDTFMEGMTKQ